MEAVMLVQKHALSALKNNLTLGKEFAEMYLTVARPHPPTKGPVRLSDTLDALGLQFPPVFGHPIANRREVTGETG
jgi:hypothetical protein